MFIKRYNKIIKIEDLVIALIQIHMEWHFMQLHKNAQIFK